MKQLRWGIMGTGNIARQFASGLNASTRHKMTSVGSRSPESARNFADLFEISTAHGDYASLLRDDSYDALYLSLPNSMHHEWTIAALRAGKHVLCEKPFAVTLKQAEEMFEVADASGKTLIEAFMYRAHPQMIAAFEAIRQGAIGDVKLIRASFCYRTNRIEGNIRFDRALAGGALMDVGCYCVNFSRAVAGEEPTEIHAIGVIKERGVDELATGILKFPGEIVAEFTCGMLLQADNTAWICGTDGHLSIPMPWKPQPGQAHYVIGRATPPRQDLAGGPPVPPPRQVVEIADNRDVYLVEADAFADCVLEGAAPFISRNDTLGNTRVLAEIRRQVGLSF